MTPIFTIMLRDLRFHSRIGVMEQERLVGNEFLVNVDFDYNAASFEPEDLKTTVSYADAYQVIKDEMGKSWELLESVAVAISRSLRRSWPIIKRCRVSIVKTSVPIKGINGTCGVTYED